MHSDTSAGAAGERIGLIAGNGTFPIAFAREAKARGITVCAVAHRDETLDALEGEVEDITWIRVGQIGKLIKTFRRAGVERAVMAGGINKVKTLSSIRPDFGGVKLLARVAGKGDDAVLRALADELEKNGVTIVPSTTFLDRIVVARGPIAGPPPSEASLADVRLGFSVLAALGEVDVGQGVVVEDGVVLAVEAVEGTDAAIRRAGALGKGGASVVKAAKRGQDMRFDVPAIGPRTIEVMAEAGAKVLAVQAGAAIVLEDEEVRRLAGEHEISVVGCDDAGGIEDE